MDQPFSATTSAEARARIPLTGIQIVSHATVSRQGGPELNATAYSFTPLLPILLSALTVSIIIFSSCILVCFLLASRMKRAIKGALLPMDQLRREIQGISDGALLQAEPLPILELEEIRRAIFGTKLDLANVRERLAEERARQLSAKSYKRLIHDLHNPTAALRQWITIMTDPATDAEGRSEAAETVPRIADQILRQVSSAKRNLEHQPEALREVDVRTCLYACLQQIRSGAAVNKKRHISFSIPELPIVVAHDPDLLQRAILNLLDNGIEASREKVDLSLEHVGTQVLIRVSDDGDGMDEGAVSLFLQGRGRSRKAERDALGLSSANHIVRTHGGKIVYRKSPLGGAAFEIRLEAL